MFRAANHASRRVFTRVGGHTKPGGQANSRAQTGGPPMPAPKKGGVSAVTVGAAAVTLGLGGTVGYAWLDPAFRDSLEATVPYADVPLSMVLGEKSPPPPAPVPDVPSRMRKKPTKPATEAVKDKTEGVAKSEDKVGPGPATEPAPPTAPVETSEPSSAPAATTAGTDDAAARAERRAQALEAEAAVENLALEETLRELSARAQMALDVAVDAQQRAASSVVAHVERVFRSLDDTSEADWSAVKDSADMKTQLCQKADQLAHAAREYLDQLTSVLDESRRNKLTAANDQLTTVQEALSNSYYRLDSAQNKMAAALSEARVMEEFRQLVDESRTKFQQEMSSIVPGVVLGEKNDKLSEEELNVLLVHAYRKVLYLQKELARMLTVEQQKFSSALQRQRHELDGVFDEKLSAELSRHQRQMEVRHQQALEALQSELENEMRQQLRRQAGAHSDHLQDVLAVQERELKLKFESAHEDRLRAERAKSQAELAGIVGEVRAVRDAITARADLDKAAHRAQKMWVACQGLKQAIRSGQLGAASWQGQLKPLKDEVTAIREVAGDSAAFVETVLTALPEEALQRGVYTEDAMRERFFKVERLCKRVSMIGDEGGSLFKYALSYLQALLVVDAFERLPSKEQRDQPISADLSTYEIVARARYCIDKDDLAQAVRYLSLLKGEPRLVASDWVQETRLLLEARQVADALLAHAAATGLQAL